MRQVSEPLICKSKYPARRCVDSTAAATDVQVLNDAALRILQVHDEDRAIALVPQHCRRG